MQAIAVALIGTLLVLFVIHLIFGIISFMGTDDEDNT